MHADFHCKEITIDLAREALKDMLSVQRAQISVESIQKTVADFYKIKVADMFSGAPPDQHRAPPPDRDVLCEGTDAEEPAGDR